MLGNWKLLKGSFFIEAEYHICGVIQVADHSWEPTVELVQANWKGEKRSQMFFIDGKNLIRLWKKLYVLRVFVSF